MPVSYNKLWKLLIDKGMKKKDLIQAAGISQSSVTKLGRNDNVNTEILVRICLALRCDIGDIMEVVPDRPYAFDEGKGSSGDRGAVGYGS